MERVPGVQDRAIERPTVEGDDRVGTTQPPGHRRQHGPFVGQLIQEVLTGAKPFLFEPAQSNDKGDGAGTATEPRRFQIEANDPCEIRGPGMGVGMPADDI